MADSIRLIAGLGNPGPKYDMTRHNAGFLVLDRLAARLGVELRDKKWDALSTRVREGAGDVVLLKPQTFMNLSGGPVAAALQFHKIQPDQMLVVHDESELSFGDLRQKIGGGHKGNNGLRDIMDRIGSRDFHRIRFGVGRPEGRDLAGHLLARFDVEQSGALPPLLDRAVDMCLAWLSAD